MLKQVFENSWVRAAALLGAIAVMLLLGYMLMAVLVPLFFAFIVAYIFDPMVGYFEHRGLSRTRVVVLLVLGIIGISLILPLLILPEVIAQAEELAKAAGQAPQEGGNSWFDRSIGMLPLEEWVVALGWVEEGTEYLNARAVIAQRVGEFIKANAAHFVERHGRELLTVGEDAGESAAAFLGSILDAFMGVALFLGNFVLFAFLAIYLLKDYEQIIAGIDGLVPPHHRERVRGFASKINIQLKGFLRGQLMVCAFLGTFYTIGMSIAGTPFAVPLGIFGGLASIVPYVGIVITVVPAVGLTLLQYGLDWHIIVVLVTFGVAQVLEGNYVTPKFVGEQVGLGPVWVILAIMVFGSTFGFVGLLLALPSAAVLKVFVEEGLAWYKQSPYFVGAEASEDGVDASD